MEAQETSNNRVGLFPEDSRGACQQSALVVHSVHLSSCRRVTARSLLLTMDPRDETEDGAPDEGRDPGEVESQVIGAQLVTEQPWEGRERVSLGLSATCRPSPGLLPSSRPDDFTQNLRHQIFLKKWV